jgi:predicted phosphoribosyltransferase
MKIFGGPPFEDRRDAGRKLAERLLSVQGRADRGLRPARGGVPVGYEISRALARRWTCSSRASSGRRGSPEFGIGAVAPGGVRVLNEYAVGQLGIPRIT